MRPTARSQVGSFVSGLLLCLYCLTHQLIGREDTLKLFDPVLIGDLCKLCEQLDQFAALGRSKEAGELGGVQGKLTTKLLKHLFTSFTCHGFPCLNAYSGTDFGQHIKRRGNQAALDAADVGMVLPGNPCNGPNRNVGAFALLSKEVARQL